MPLELDTALMVEHLLALMLSFALALPIGWDREVRERSAGLRTFPLVALSSCAFVLLARSEFDGDAQARIMQGLVTGVGFIGGGAILKSGDRVRGTATATSIWTTGALGAAVGYGRLEIAVLLSVMTFLTFRLLGKVKEKTALVDDEDAELPPVD